MFDAVSFTVGIFSGGFLGAIGAIVVKTVRIDQLETDVFIRDTLLDAAQKKLRTLTERDSKGRFTGGK
jgi:hypothetical protein